MKKGILVFLILAAVCALLLVFLVREDESGKSLYEKTVENGKAEDMDAYIQREQMETEPYTEETYLGIYDVMKSENAPEDFPFQQDQSKMISQSEQDRIGQREAIYSYLKACWNYSYLKPERLEKELETIVHPTLLENLQNLVNRRRESCDEYQMITDFSYMYYYDQFAYEDTTSENVRTVAVFLMGECDGDIGFFIKYPSFSAGSVPVYYLFQMVKEDGSDWKITAVNRWSDTRYGAIREYLWADRYVVDDSELREIFPEIWLTQYDFIGVAKEPDRTTQKQYAQLVSRFFDVMYGKVPDQAGSLEELKEITTEALYEKMSTDDAILSQMNAAKDGKVHYPENYHSSLIEMGALWSTVYQFKNAGTDYYVFEEEFPLTADTAQFGYMEGSWYYSILFMIDTSGPQPLIHDYAVYILFETDEDGIEGKG